MGMEMGVWAGGFEDVRLIKLHDLTQGMKMKLIHRASGRAFGASGVGVCIYRVSALMRRTEPLMPP